MRSGEQRTDAPEELAARWGAPATPTPAAPAPLFLVSWVVIVPGTVLLLAVSLDVSVVFPASAAPIVALLALASTTLVSLGAYEAHHAGRARAPQRAREKAYRHARRGHWRRLAEIPDRELVSSVALAFLPDLARLSRRLEIASRTARFAREHACARQRAWIDESVLPLLENLDDPRACDEITRLAAALPRSWERPWPLAPTLNPVRHRLEALVAALSRGGPMRQLQNLSPCPPPPAAPPPRRRVDDEGRAATGWLLFFVLNVVVFGAVLIAAT